MTKHINHILLLPLALFLFSCGAGNGGQDAATTTDTTSVAPTPAPAYDSTLPKGKVTDSIACRNQSSQNYALYIPSYYTPNKPFPCIFFFDAHARGAMPVSMYKALAEQYGFVLAGSNASKNGTQWPVTEAAVKELMLDVRSRINIDPKRIYTSGFSGGSRVASSIAIQDGGVAGVIGCAAGFPNVQQDIPTKFDYFGMVGDYDFNLAEMQQLDAMLAQNGFSHQLLTFDGKHGWPTPADFHTALLWIQVNAMKENLQPKNDTLIAALKNDYSKRIAAATSSGDAIKEHDLLDGMVRTLNGLSDISVYQKQLAGLVAGNRYKSEVTLQAQLQQVEQTQQQLLQKQFTQQDAKWWTNEIAALNQSIHHAKTQQEGQMNRRLLNYLGLVSYLNTDHALNIGDLPNAANYLKIFKMADPQNPDCDYLSAIYYMKQGSQQQAIASLKTAASLGYSEVVSLITEPAFSTIQDDARFKSVIAKVRVNNVAK